MILASTVARNAAVGGVSDALAGGTLEIRDSATVLATIDLPDPCLGSPSGGSAGLTGSWSAAATGAGTPDNFRLRTTGDADAITGSVGTSGADLILDRSNIAVGDTVSVTTAQLSQMTGEGVTGSGDLTLPAAELSGEGTVTSGGGATAWYEDDFESYANTAALAAEYSDDSTGVGRIELATGLTGLPNGGSKAVRRTWVGATTTDESALSIEFPDAAVDQPTEVWIELYTNMGGHTQTGGNTGDKVLFLQDEDFNRWDLMQATGGTIICTAGSAGVVNDGDANETVRWKTAWPNGSVISFPTSYVGVDEWKQLRFHCVMGRASATGSITVWEDGVQVFGTNASGLNTNEAGDYFRYLQIGANSSAASGAEQLFTDVKVYTSNPGW